MPRFLRCSDYALGCSYNTTYDKLTFVIEDVYCVVLQVFKF